MTENTRPLRDFFQSLPQGDPSYLVGADLTVIPLSSIGGGIVVSIVPGNGVGVDSSSAENPVVSLDSSSIASLSLADSALQPGSVTISDIVATGAPSSTTYLRGDGTWSSVGGGGGGGQVDSVVAGDGINVDATDPASPVVSLSSETLSSLALADSSVQPGDLPPAPVNADWNAGSGLAEILNKPSIPSTPGDIGAATAAQGALADTAVQLSEDKAAISDWSARTADKVLTADGLEDALDPVALTYASPVAVPWKSGYSFDLVATGNITFGNPTDVVPRSYIDIVVYGDSATERSLAFGANFKGPLPDLTVTNTVGLHLTFYAISATNISVTWWEVGS